MNSKSDDLFREQAQLNADFRQAAAEMSSLAMPASTSGDQVKHTHADCSGKLRTLSRHLDEQLPREPTLVLKCSLGGAATSLFHIHPTEHLLYKHEYERFKLTVTVADLLLLALNLILLNQVWLDKLHHFWVLYCYATIILREHILSVNGSKIKAWWFWHHYLSVALTGVMLIWPANESYMAFRLQFMTFTFYLGVVQILQFEYQKSRLYTLRALSKARPMDLTTETAIPAQKSLVASLVVLLPSLLFGYMFQLYNAWTLIQLSGVLNSKNLLETFMDHSHELASAALLFALATGNILVTVQSYLDKLGTFVNERFQTKSKQQ